MAAKYPKPLCEEIVKGPGDVVANQQLNEKIRRQNVHLFFQSPFFATQDQSEEEFEGPEADEPELPAQNNTKNENPLTTAEIQLIAKLHTNLSHPPSEQFLRVLQAAGAKDTVLAYFKYDFTCETCRLQRLPKSRRKAAVPPVEYGGSWFQFPSIEFGSRC